MNVEAISNFIPLRRDEAATLALSRLSSRCYTVYVKSQYCSDGTVVNSSELESGENAGGPKALGSDNVGHKLLQMMGWQGGGLGAGGSGISEPITAQSFANREGLGTSNAGREFKARLRALIEEYAASSNPYDLVFTAGFDNEQRKELHK